MPASVDSFFDDYARLYTAGDVKGVTNLCHCPFVAIRRGEAIHMPDRGAVWDHFASAIAAYRRAAHAETWKPVEIDSRHPRRALRLRDRALECARCGRAGDSRHLVELPTARHVGRVALAFVHESLLSRAGLPAHRFIRKARKTASHPTRRGLAARYLFGARRTGRSANGRRVGNRSHRQLPRIFWVAQSE